MSEFCCGKSGPEPLTRREMLRRAGAGFGALALAQILAEASDAPHFRPRATSVISLFMGGGPSQVDTFDPKPLLSKLHGKEVPASIAKDIPRIARAPLENLFGSPYAFRKHGQSGIEVSDLFPEVARHVDDLCILRSMKHDSPIHAPAEYIALTGTGVGDRPSLGAWVTYGLGSENRDLPAFIVFNSDGSARPPGYHAGFLPARFQGTVCDGPGGIRDLAMPEGVGTEERRGQLDLLARLNELHRDRQPGESELEARIRSYELAFRMQVSAPEVFDLAGESDATKRAYGMDQKEKEGAEFSRHCLLARRLVERGVRFIQVRAGNWDAHGKLFENHGRKARHTDRAVAALLGDLKQRGLLDQTLVVWGGEFGRTPAAQGGLGADAGRDHSPSGYSMWLAGGGVRGGQVIGATDPVGYSVTERPIHPNDLNATILHALGLDQRKLVYTHHNRQEIPTVLGGEVVREVFG
ncbi:MAG TPA: DUF1501 domain-containing protein [Planctomycetota bacterium]|nr:DUF1501 domain-containing protein [Planctomycetota bacterium]